MAETALQILKSALAKVNLDPASAQMSPREQAIKAAQLVISEPVASMTVAATVAAVALTPEEFNAAYREKGWTHASLAARWGKFPPSIGRIARDPERGIVWDDAVRGLPPRAKDDSTSHNPLPCLTPDDFKAAYSQRGWSRLELAQRWGKIPNYISRIGNKTDRALHWDDAIRGLPDRRK